MLCRGRVAESLRWVEEAMNAAETYGDADLMIVGHQAAEVAYFWLGDPIKTRAHADRVLALYGQERHGHLVRVLNHDLKAHSLCYSALSTWMLGYPEQAVTIGDAGDAHARRFGHPFDLCWTLTRGCMVFEFLGEPDECLKRIKEAGRLGRENSLSALAEALVPETGIALIRKGQIAEGVALLKRGIAFWEGSDGRFLNPRCKSVLAEGIAQLGDPDGALALANEAIAQVEQPGWEERWYYAETLRIKGGLLALKGDPEGAEGAYIASLDWARQQQAKSWELRTATGYARLLRDQGRVGEAQELLAPVYGWFTEGFATKDLKKAGALLDDLTHASALPNEGSAVVGTAVDGGYTRRPASSG